MESETILDLAKRWLELDQDASTRKEIEDLIGANKLDELESRLRHRIAFGTAGLRSSMKAGFAHMNSTTVLQASQGLAQYILDQDLVGAFSVPDTSNKGTTHSEQFGTESAGLTQSGRSKPLKIVLGYDARHNSEKFARHAAVAFLNKSARFQVLWLGKSGQWAHTPMVPYAIKHFGAVAGVMVTASHNPKNDNGYKVYWSNGCQIIPPHDAGIAAAIDKEISILSWDTTIEDAKYDSNVDHIFVELQHNYLASIPRLFHPPSSADMEPLSTPIFMYTPMHGVGLPYMEGATAEIGLQSCMRVVEAQAQPDPNFPTVPFPNPEEKGALDLAIREAENVGSNLIIANDPDADRFAAAERVNAGEFDNGQWKQFTGNQMGVLLASFILETYIGDKSKIAMLASTVSSRMLATMAEKEGFQFRETLTGFKWLGNVAQDMQQEGFDPVFAYEEAIGYMFPSIVWDKDGIAAAAVFLQAWWTWQRQGLTPWQRLQQMYEKYGYFEDANTYFITPSPATTNKVFTDIRKLNKGSRPQMIGDRNILRWRDLTFGYDSNTAENIPDLPVDASAQMITCELEDVVLTARGSGTEPKIKLYIEARGQTSDQAQMRAKSVLQDLLEEWFTAEYGLKMAGT